MAVKKSKTLIQLKDDLEKAKRDLQNLGQQQLMVQGIIHYLTQEVQKLEGKD